MVRVVVGLRDGKVRLAASSQCNLKAHFGTQLTAALEVFRADEMAAVGEPKLVDHSTVRRPAIGEALAALRTSVEIGDGLLAKKATKDDFGGFWNAR